MHRNIQADKNELIKLFLETTFAAKCLLGKKANNKKNRHAVAKEIIILKDHLTYGRSFGQIAEEHKIPERKIGDMYEAAFKKLKRGIQIIDEISKKTEKLQASSLKKRPEEHLFDETRDSSREFETFLRNKPSLPQKKQRKRKKKT